MLPAVLPLLLLGFVSLFHMTSAQQKRVSPWVAVKDGQLAWVALGMCLNALYELDHPSKAAVPAILIITMRWCFLGMVIMTSLTAAFAPVLATPTARPAGLWANLWHFRVFFGSVLEVAIVAYLYGIVHLTTQA